MAPGRFITVGHSDRTLDEFIALLESAGTNVVADVRAIPRSRANPQFDRPTLSAALASRRIAYEHLATLGGRRPRTKEVPPEVNGLWTNESFYNYADYALSAPFEAGIARLAELGRDGVCAVMCAEALWWRCHRRIIADHLLARGETVLHLLGRGHTPSARLTPGALIRQDGTIAYPRPDGVA